MKTNKKTAKNTKTSKAKTKKVAPKTKAKKQIKKSSKSKKPVKKVSSKSTKKVDKKVTKKATKKVTKNNTKKNTTKKNRPVKQVETEVKVEQQIITSTPVEIQSKSSVTKYLPLILIIVAILAIFTLLINKKTIEDYYFSSNLDYYRYNLETDNQNWTEISNETIVETDIKNINISIQNTKDNSTISIDSQVPYFQYLGEEYIASPINKEYSIDYIYFNPSVESKLEFVSSNDCAKITNNTIKAIKDGSTTIYVVIDGNKEKILEMDICSNIVDRPKEFDTSKPFLTCEQFTDEENELVDKILEKKIEKVGYQTRAGAVETLRFLTLDFPYRVTYFNENGRLPYVDGEGRYYHKGLYLSEGKYNDLIDPKRDNKGTWGCNIYSYPAEGYESNGVDCSGLLCWALYNDGFDPDDQRGANLLMELGEIVVTKEAVDSGKVKVGDFVHNNEAESHAGMIIGIDGDDYYVAQAIWYNPFGVCIVKYPKEVFIQHWLQVILLDDYYKNDGQLTNMWY